MIRKQSTVLLYGYGHAGVDLSVLNNLQFMEARLVVAAGASGRFDTFTFTPLVAVAFFNVTATNQAATDFERAAH